MSSWFASCSISGNSARVIRRISPWANASPLLRILVSQTGAGKWSSSTDNAPRGSPTLNTPAKLSEWGWRIESGSTVHSCSVGQYLGAVDAHRSCQCHEAVLLSPQGPVAVSALVPTSVRYTRQSQENIHHARDPSFSFRMGHRARAQLSGFQVVVSRPQGAGIR